MSITNQSSQVPSSISGVSVVPPPFWKPEPALWFAQVEAQFEIAGITTDSTKFNHVISAIESDVLASVSDLILQPNDGDKYATLKQRLIDLHSESQESKIRTLLQGIELGDQRPSQLLSRMRALAGEAVGDALLKSLWLSQLPPTTQSILAALNEDLSKLAVVADKIADLPVHNIHVATTQASSNSQTQHLEKKIEQLMLQLNDLSTAVYRQGRTRSNSRNRFRQRSPSRRRFRQYQEPSNGLCFYHTNFGDKARKCESPCSFNQGN